MNNYLVKLVIGAVIFFLIKMFAVELQNEWTYVLGFGACLLITIIYDMIDVSQKVEKDNA